MGLSSNTNVELIRATYEGAPAANARHLAALFTPKTRWTEAAGFPYAGTYIGPEAIKHNVFERLSSEWLDYNAKAEHFVTDGTDVVVLGVYSGTYRKSGRYMEARFAHHWTLSDGKVVSFEQYVDSHKVRQAIE
jgi:uncharacterized protein